MKPLTLIYMLLMLVQASFAQHPDSLSGTFKIRKPAGSVYTRGAYPATLDGYKYDYSADTFMTSTFGGACVVTSSIAGNLPITYPESAKNAGISGTVYVSYEWDEKGSPVKIALERGTHSTLDKAALDYVATMRAVKGETLQTGLRFIMPITFTLGQNNQP